MKLRYWRGQLRSRYAEWAAIYDQYDCGYHLARYMSSRLSRAEDRVNEAIRMCRSLDPSFTMEEIKA
jgi:hypothetical protein